MRKLKTNKTKNEVRIGTSGWVYKSWHDILYPKQIKKNFLTFYARHFNSVEINTSFYHLPKKSTFEKWREETPKNFAFAVKLSRYITHIKRIKHCKESVGLFLDRAVGLKHKLAVILVQLPPSLKFDKELIEQFLKDIKFAQQKRKAEVRWALEPRNPSWFEEKNLSLTRDLVKKYFTVDRFALVFAHSSLLPHYDPDDTENTFSTFIYIRFHGPKEFAASQYGTKLLRPWAKRITQWQDRGKTAFAYFNDDAHGYAIKDARTLQKLVKKG